MSVAELTEPTVDERDGRVVLAQRFAVSGPGPVLLRARLSVGLGERGREDDAPVGAARPEILYWDNGVGLRRTEDCVVDSPSEIELVVLPVPDTITDIVVSGARAEEVAAS
ncbi:hypothetical protein [Pseudonocardia oroxyli]|uniref:Uncharacterized protein n=1 Tax=Pseudonocardia oroxyli TaxID=366584 RepID=A0A1G7PAC7_PSEOR|nr:hypothetical protein [Pseudonocardia oroxyli]SDF83164.1 hypothetical protein SAMN05216377_10759 [Pseudonocardia oroxyli]